MSNFAPDTEFFLNSSCVRQRSHKIFEELKNGRGHWNINPSKISSCAEFVVETIHHNYPSLNIPFHSRRGHLRAGGIDRVAQLRAHCKADEKLFAEYDLIITSVFVDAGAGEHWSYLGKDQKKYARSEGLAVASYDFFNQGLMSSDKSNPLQVDPEGIAKLTRESFAHTFQSTKEHPLLGLETRLSMLKKLAICMNEHPEFFEVNGKTRLGHLGLYFKKQAKNHTLRAAFILRTVLLAFEKMWPERPSPLELRFGDLWHYAPWGSSQESTSYIAFHKLSQWLSYSLMEALQDEGITIIGLDDLTGLPEYRNGGLLIDAKVLIPQDPLLLTQGLKPDHEAIIEWRAATVCLLDELATPIRKLLNKSAEDLPLVKILEGGTWSAGRRFAQKLRPNSSSPISIVSDGSVF